MAVTTKLMTAEEFWQRANEFSGCELVRGIVVPKHGTGIAGVNVSPTGGKHGEIEIRIRAMLVDFLRQKPLGRAYGGEVGFILRSNPDLVRAPDVAFVSAQRLSESPGGFIPLAPDLAVEIVSPTDSLSLIQKKVFDYLDAGTRLVWVVDPESQSVTVYQSRASIRVLTESDTLDGADFLPGFSSPVKSVFES